MPEEANHHFIMEIIMNKLEFSFNSNKCYNSSDDHLSRNISINFEIDADLGADQVVEEFNNFLYLSGFKDTKVQIAD